MDTKLTEIGQIAITVSDVAAAVVYYRDVLGLEFLFSPMPSLAFLAAGPIRIMLSSPEGAGRIGANSVLYFKVHNIQDAHATIAGRGSAVEASPHLIARMPDHDLWMSFLRDPDGNLVGLMEKVPSAESV